MAKLKRYWDWNQRARSGTGFDSTEDGAAPAGLSCGIAGGIVLAAHNASVRSGSPQVCKTFLLTNLADGFIRMA